jgi:AraC-like DNA-binding protein
VENLPYPGVRMEGVTFHRALFSNPFYFEAPIEPFGLAYLVRKGPIVLEIVSSGRAEHNLATGTVVSMSGLIPHRFRSAASGRRPNISNLAIVPLSTPNSSSLEMLVGKVPNESLLTAGMSTGPLVITSNEEPLTNMRIWKAFEQIEEELAHNDPVGWTRDAVERLAEIMLLNMMRTGVERAVQGDANVRALLDMRLLRVLMKIGRDPFHDWSVAELARSAGMSRTAFAVHFRNVLRTSPLQLVTLLRLRAATADLATSVHSIEDVALKCGYGSSAAFIRAFQRNFGTTPAKWRAQHQS